MNEFLRIRRMLQRKGDEMLKTKYIYTNIRKWIGTIQRPFIERQIMSFLAGESLQIMRRLTRRVSSLLGPREERRGLASQRACLGMNW